MKDSTFKKYCLVIDEWFVNGRNGTKAYLKYYPNSSYESADSSFRTIVEIPRISEYIQDKIKNKSKELDITLNKQLERLNLIIENPLEKSSDKVNAIKEQNKLLALYKDHNKQKKSDLITEKVSISFKNKK